MKRREEIMKTKEFYGEKRGENEGYFWKRGEGEKMMTLQQFLLMISAGFLSIKWEQQ